MTIAQALILRSDLQKNIAQLESRLLLNAQVQEGLKPNEKPEELFSKLENILAQYQDIVFAINRTNTLTKVENRLTLADLIVKRDILDKKLSVMRGFLDRANDLIQKYTKAEIRVFPSVDVSSYRKTIDSLSKERRELETKIQGLNWTTELVE